MEVLHVHGRGCQHGALHTLAEPVGLAIHVGEGVDGLAFVLPTLVGAVADGYYCHIHLVWFDFHVPVFAERTAYPASVESKCLGQQDEFFAFVAKMFVQVGQVATHHGDIVHGSAETQEFGEQAGKGFGFVGHQLDMEPFGGIACSDLLVEGFHLGGQQWAVAVLAHAVARKDGFLYCHGVF